ncbi:MAG: hypothetical protein JW969_14975 [Spirochaetales bacterium]|nr:hypothetical protein [Spirochaetales bacterium]
MNDEELFGGEVAVELDRSVSIVKLFAVPNTTDGWSFDDFGFYTMSPDSSDDNPVYREINFTLCIVHFIKN